MLGTGVKRRSLPLLAALMVSAALLLAACVSSDAYVPPSGERVKVSAQVMDFFKKYETELTSTHTGAFAVSKSGTYAGYSYCPAQRCAPNRSAGQEAIAECAHGGEPCYVFATNRDIRFDYDVVP